MPITPKWLRPCGPTGLVYSQIRDGKYNDAIKILEAQLQKNCTSRAALSLLGFCYYRVEDFARAADVYDRLTKCYPTIDIYFRYKCQALFLAGNYEEAEECLLKVAPTNIDDVSRILHANIKFEEDDVSACMMLLKTCSQESPKTIAAFAAALYKEGKYKDALDKYFECFNQFGYEPDIAYCTALCHYRLNEFQSALKLVEEIIDRAHNSHRERFDTELKECSSWCWLQKTFLIEAYNLKIAIEYDNGNIAQARDIMQEMPYRNEHELDPVSLHNQAIIDMDTDSTSGMKKLIFLLTNPPFPPETFRNLLLLYCKHGRQDLAAEILAGNELLADRLLTENLRDYLNACLIIEISPDEAFRKFELLSNENADTIRKLKLKHFNYRKLSDHNATGDASHAIRQSMNMLVPTLLAQARILWDRDDYSGAEMALQRMSDLCGNLNEWRLCMGHAIFMQQDLRYMDAIENYSPIIKSLTINNILDVSPIVLANLCVAYIMMNQNENAETLLQQLQQEEDRQILLENCFIPHHSCIVNLVIGTLYCARNNYEFGIERICKSLYPLDPKLGADTWHYAKRCFLALMEKMAKQIVVLKPTIIRIILDFFDDVENMGKDLPATSDEGVQQKTSTSPPTIAMQVRRLKYVFLQLIE